MKDPIKYAPQKASQFFLFVSLYQNWLREH
uniref:Uncharacterized protein n=1 Tax=Arundo donax TaxID=35708 RepID=A0A0A9BRF2_ARUDO